MAEGGAFSLPLCLIQRQARRYSIALIFADVELHRPINYSNASARERRDMALEGMRGTNNSITSIARLSNQRTITSLYVARRHRHTASDSGLRGTSK